MNYRMIVPDKGGMYRLSNSLDIDNSRTEQMDAKAEAFAYVMGFINNLSFDTRIKNETEKLQTQIKARLVPNGGVLLCVIYTQHIDTGYKSFDNMFVADAGMDYKTVVTKYMDMPKWMAGVNAAYTKMELYIWVTEI